MYTCNCDEMCSIINTYRISKKNKSNIQTVQILKCNRILTENTKKVPCDYYEENIIKESIYYVQDNFSEYKKQASTEKKQKKVTYKDISNLLHKHLEYLALMQTIRTF